MTKKQVRHWLLAGAVFLAWPAFAENPAPAPKAPPPRVPFTAFRTKPILDLKLREKAETGQSQSLVVPDAQNAGNGMIRIRPLRPLAKPDLPREEAKKKSESILFTPNAQESDIAVTAKPSPEDVMPGPLSVTPARETKSASAAGRMPPVPPRKPGMDGDGQPNLIERIMATRVEPGTLKVENTPEAPSPKTETTTPRPPEPVVMNEPVSTADTEAGTDEVMDSVRIRDRDNDRFSSHSRMDGSVYSTGRSTRTKAKSMSSLGLPDDMGNLRLGSLEQGDGVSPVLMPGQSVTKAAPDAAPTNGKGVPHDVIVFFQEASADLEVGQMDVINNDVVAMLKNNPGLELEIVGYAEPQKGGTDATRKMALARALMIREYLVRQHIAEDRLTSEGKADKTSVEPRDRVEMYFDR